VTFIMPFSGEAPTSSSGDTAQDDADHDEDLSPDNPAEPKQTAGVA